jgi:hypothetical protein
VPPKSGGQTPVASEWQGSLRDLALQRPGLPAGIRSSLESREAQPAERPVRAVLCPFRFHCVRQQPLGRHQPKHLVLPVCRVSPIGACLSPALPPFRPPCAHTRSRVRSNHAAAARPVRGHDFPGAGLLQRPHTPRSQVVLARSGPSAFVSPATSCLDSPLRWMFLRGLVSPCGALLSAAPALPGSTYCSASPATAAFRASPVPSVAQPQLCQLSGVQARPNGTQRLTIRPTYIVDSFLRPLQDSFYKTLNAEDLAVAKANNYNFDHPDALDREVRPRAHKHLLRKHARLQSTALPPLPKPPQHATRARLCTTHPFINPLKSPLNYSSIQYCVCPGHRGGPGKAQGGPLRGHPRVRLCQPLAAARDAPGACVPPTHIHAQHHASNPIPGHAL